MKYISTRGAGEPVSAAEAILTGLAPDGGLYVPESFPEPLSGADFAALSALSYPERAARIMRLFLDDFSEEELLSYAKSAYSDEKFDSSPAPLVRVGGRRYLELFHGPTSAFKDMALQMLPYLLSASLQKRGQREDALILVATSGDTGKAALEGFKDVPRTNVLVFYPKDGVSDIQKLQMTTQEGENVAVSAVSGNFDDTQNGVKELFSSEEMRRELASLGLRFSSANSINWGRVLPQIVYYVSAYCDLGNETGTLPERINFCVPTGNFGNILAAYYAKQLGVPVHKLLCASNANRVLTEFIRTGRYNRKREFHLTISPSMDILISSNLERLLFELVGRDADRVSAYMRRLRETGEYTVDEAVKTRLTDLFYGDFCDDNETKATIATVFKEDAYLLDPHTAVAVNVCDAYLAETGDETPAVVVATASPFKFCESVLAAIGAPLQSGGFELISDLSRVSGLTPPAPILALAGKPERFSAVFERDEMGKSTLLFAKDRAKHR
ncbi:threonine synthase [Oscillospiraceae bacterium OttesenSCG-928-G22]|nr:threonine synthase [Oscillospiraceae bacterium OttesenSCG-928-G22]